MEGYDKNFFKVRGGVNQQFSQLVFVIPRPNPPVSAPQFRPKFSAQPRPNLGPTSAQPRPNLGPTPAQHFVVCCVFGLVCVVCLFLCVCVVCVLLLMLLSYVLLYVVVVCVCVVIYILSDLLNISSCRCHLPGRNKKHSTVFSPRDLLQQKR